MERASGILLFLFSSVWIQWTLISQIHCHILILCPIQLRLRQRRSPNVDLPHRERQSSAVNNYNKSMIGGLTGSYAPGKAISWHKWNLRGIKTHQRAKNWKWGEQT